MHRVLPICRRHDRLGRSPYRLPAVADEWSVRLTGLDTVGYGSSALAWRRRVKRQCANAATRTFGADPAGAAVGSGVSLECRSEWHAGLQRLVSGHYRARLTSLHFTGTIMSLDYWLPECCLIIRLSRRSAKAHHRAGTSAGR